MKSFHIIICVMIMLKICFTKLNECPSVQSYHSVLYYDSYATRSFLRIPNTNILLVNTVSDVSQASIVYFNDISTMAGEILNVVKRNSTPSLSPNFELIFQSNSRFNWLIFYQKKTLELSKASQFLFIDFFTWQNEFILADYSIIDMVFVSKLDQILIINSSKMILADPYTLVALKELTVQRSQSMIVVKNTYFAIVTMWYNEIYIIDTLTLSVIKILSNVKYPNTYNSYQQKTQIYTLKDQSKLLMCTNNHGVFTWSIDLDTLEAQYNGYIDAVNLDPAKKEYKTFEKYPYDDIFFFSGWHSRTVIVKIIDLKQKQYLTMFDADMYDNEYNIDSFNLVYKEPIFSGIKTPMIIIGDYKYTYFLPLVVNEETIDLPTISNPDYLDGYINYWDWYQFDESDNKLIQSTGYYVTIYDIQEQQFTFYLCNFIVSSLTPPQVYKSFSDFQTDAYQRRTMYQSNNQDVYVIVYKSTIYISLRSYPGDFYHVTKPSLIKPIYKIRGSLNRVKSCEECLLIRVGSTSTHYITTTKIYPYDSPQTNVNLSKFSLLWSKIGQNLDPFFMNNSIWVVFSFPYSTYTPSGYLFLLVNASAGTSVQLKVGPTDPLNLNSNKSSYAIISMEDSSNQEIIGVDLIGNLYSWNLLDQTYKFTKQISNCLNSEIGDIFHYMGRKWLITVCDDFVARIYDFQNNITIELKEIQLFSMPLALKAFQDPMIIVITDYSIADSHIYKFDTQTQSFSFFITLTKGKFKDSVIGVELLKDKTLWIQYTLSNTFFEIEACLDNIQKCKYCAQTTYFNSSETYDDSALYGYGNSTHPYTGSANYYTTMLKAQLYTELIGDAKLIEVNINVDSQYPIKLREGLLKSEFSSLISLNFQFTSGTTSIENTFNINVESSLSFSGYNYVALRDATLNFTNPEAAFSSKCGLVFTSITDMAVLQNIKINTTECSKIIANSTNLVIDSFIISDQDFTMSGPIIEINDSKQLNISNLIVHNLILGNNTSIISSGSQLELRLINTIITECSCPQDDVQPNTSSISAPLFSAGLIKASGLLVSDNTFCKKNILLSATSLEHQNLEFELFDVVINNNQFQATSEQLFFSAMYKQRVLPAHSIHFYNITFQSNNLFQKDDSNSDLIQATMIIVSKIETISFEEVHSIDQDSISIAEIEYSTTMTFDKVTCVNQNIFLTASTDTTSDSQNGCLKLSEVKFLEFSGLTIENKIAYDSPMVSLSNVAYNNTNLKISSSQFIHLQLVQTLNNTNASPIMIKSINQLDITFESCIFVDNTLIGPISSFTYSTTGFWVENFVGKVSVKGSSFLKSTSNSRYNFIYVSSRSVDISDSTFSQQSFDSDYSSGIYGGFMHLETINIDVQRCSFSKSRAGVGSFIYASASGEELIMNILESQFEEGFASSNGGAIYVNIGTSVLNFNCQDCQFTNIYTFSEGSSVVSFIQEKKEMKTYHECQFNNGRLVNWFGKKDNIFSSLNYFKLNIVNFEYYFSDNLLRNSDSLNDLYNNQKIFQGSLFTFDSSIINLISLDIFNLAKQSQSSSTPVLFYAKNSSIILNDIHFSNSTFKESSISLDLSTLTIESSSFINIKQDYILRLLTSQINLQIDDRSPSSDSISLIELNQSSLNCNKMTMFSNITCIASDCNGSVFSLLNSEFQISDTKIVDSHASFGGAMFIQGISKSSSIENCDFENNIADYSGGSIYLKGNEADEFILNIENSRFVKNTAVKGRGGAIFIRSDTSNSANQKVLIDNSRIESNSAQACGSLDIQDITSTISNSTEIFNNIGVIFGKNIISYPSQLFIENTTVIDSLDNQFDLEINGFQSGSGLEVITFKLMSEFSEEIVPVTEAEESEFQVSVSFDTSDSLLGYSIRGTTSVGYEKGVGFQFSDLELIGLPETSATLLFRSDQIKRFNTTTNQYMDDYSFKVRITFRNCLSGEQVTEYSAYKECTTCKAGYYSFNLETCQDCPVGATCAGGNSIVINSGYWREDAQSENILYCYNLEANCIGGMFGDDSCYEGHIGALCEECDIFGTRGRSYSKSGKYSCMDCSSIFRNYLTVTGLILWTLISMTLAIRGDLIFVQQQQAAILAKSRAELMRSSTRANIELTLRRKTITESGDIEKSIEMTSSRILGTKRIQTQKSQQFKGDNKTGVYIKMITNQFQIVGSIATFNLSIPSGIIEFPSTLGEPLRQTLNSLDCILKDISTEIPIIYFRLLFSFVIPCLYLLIFITGLLLQHYLMSKAKKFPVYSISTAIIFLVIYLQPDLVAQSISLISCREIGNKMYILSNVSFECYTDSYAKYTLILVIPVLLTWVMAIPLFLFMMLKQNKNKLENMDVRLRYGFLYKEYKKEAFYWEFVKMAEKLAIILSLNFYSDSIITKGILVFIIVTIYGILTLIIQPFREEVINESDVHATNICAITIILGLFIYKNDFDYFIYPAFLLIIVANVWYFLSIIYKIGFEYFQKFKEPFVKILAYLAKYFSIIDKIYKGVPNKQMLNPDLKAKVQRVLRQFLQLNFDKKKQLYLDMCSQQLESRCSKQIRLENNIKTNNPTDEIEPLQILMINSMDERQSQPTELNTKIELVQIPENYTLISPINRHDTIQFTQDKNQLIPMTPSQVSSFATLIQNNMKPA